MDASMMMSQRPVASSNNSKPAASSSSSGSTIGKYKGVMLCNRPSHSGPAQAGNTANRAVGTSKMVPFRAGGHNPIENDIGLTRAKPKRHAAPRKKVVSITAKHKQWLKNYTAKKLTIEAQMEKEDEAKQLRTHKFMDRERRMRNAILDNVKGRRRKQNETNNLIEEPQTTARSREEELEDLLEFTQGINEENFDKEMEAMLENEEDVDWVNAMIAEGNFDDAVEFDPESDDNELVHPDTGVGGYDGDDAISRKEWRQRMTETVDPETGEPSDEDDAISRRDYLKEQGIDVQRVHASDERIRAALAHSGGALTAEALKEWKSKGDKGQGHADDGNSVDDDVLSTASQVLADSKKIRSVHSARSVAAVAKRKQEKKGITLPQIKEIRPPVIVTLDEKRLNYKKHVNQLPYMNRNPAV